MITIEERGRFVSCIHFKAIWCVFDHLNVALLLHNEAVILECHIWIQAGERMFPIGLIPIICRYESISSAAAQITRSK